MMSKITPFILCVVCTFFSAPVFAHRVLLETRTQTANVVQLRYANEKPLSFATYELRLPGQKNPTQSGKTDAEGQIVFLANAAQTKWQIKVFSADGHGIDKLIDFPMESINKPLQAGGDLPRNSADRTVKTDDSTAPPMAAFFVDLSTMPPVFLWISGLSILFGVFGLFQLLAKKR